MKAKFLPIIIILKETLYITVHTVFEARSQMPNVLLEKYHNKRRKDIAYGSFSPTSTAGFKV